MRTQAITVGATALLALSDLAVASPAPASAAHQHGGSPAEVLAWNEIAVRTGLAVTQTPQEAILRLAYVQAAVFDAVDAIDGGYQPYAGHLRAHGTTDAAAAVAAAAHRILLVQYPSQQSALDAEYAATLGGTPDGPAKTRGVALGESAAAGVQAARAHDGFEASVP